MSQLNAPSYDVQRSTGECAATGQPLEPGQTYYAALVETVPEDQGEGKATDAGLRRVDVSESAWVGGFRPERLFSYWRSTVPEPRAKQKLLVDDGVLMNLFSRLEGEEGPQRVAFRYVLALILMRKRLLRYDGSRREGGGEGGREGGETRRFVGDSSASALGEGVRDVWLMTPKEDVGRGPLGRWDEMATVEVVDPRLDEAGVQAVLDSLGQVLEAEL